MHLTQLEIQREVERAKREGHWGDMVATANQKRVDDMRYLMQFHQADPTHISFFLGMAQTLDIFGPEGPKNVKEPIGGRLGKAVILCGEDECRWVDYSTPGNILFGYNMAHAEVPQDIYYWAAGALQTWDDWHDPDEAIDWRRWIDGSVGDDPRDKAAVDFGAHLYEKYGLNLTQEDFERELTLSVLESLQSPAEEHEITAPPEPQENQYEPGTFDN